MRVLRALPVLILIGAAPAHRYTIDAGESEVSARVAFLGFGSKTARFPKVSGGITLPRDDPQRIDLVVRLDATALTAPDGVTLARLKGPKFFDVTRHPTILFSGRKMQMTGDREAQISGEITARGVTRPATLSVRFNAPPLRVDGGTPLTLNAETVIDRREFGMTAYPLIVGRKVRIRIRAALIPA